MFRQVTTMAGELHVEEQLNADSTEASQAAINDSQTRQRSTIGFTYNDLGAAVTVASKIHEEAGNESCTLLQISAWMGTTTSSSAFRSQIAATRMFGIIESDGPEDYRLSALGRRLMDPQQAAKAKADAFLNVPLFLKLYEAYKEGVLPPTAALERAIEQAGVPSKQKDRARQVFERSAEVAGYFAHGRNRLVAPAFKTPDTKPEQGGKLDDSKAGGEGAGVGKGGSGSGGASAPTFNLDPLLIALLYKIPAQGDGWPAEKRVRWFRTFAMNVSQVYDTDDSAAPVELNVTLSASTSTASP